MIGHFHRGVHLAASFPCFSDKEMSHLQDRVSSEATLGDWVAWQESRSSPTILISSPFWIWLNELQLYHVPNNALQPLNICWLKMNKWRHYKILGFPQLTPMRNTLQLTTPDGNKHWGCHKGPQSPSTTQDQPPLDKDIFFAELQILITTYP